MRSRRASARAARGPAVATRRTAAIGGAAMALTATALPGRPRRAPPPPSASRAGVCHPSPAVRPFLVGWSGGGGGVCGGHPRAGRIPSHPAALVDGHGVSGGGPARRHRRHHKPAAATGWVAAGRVRRPRRWRGRRSAGHTRRQRATRACAWRGPLRSPPLPDPCTFLASPPPSSPSCSGSPCCVSPGPIVPF